LKVQASVGALLAECGCEPVVRSSTRKDEIMANTRQKGYGLTADVQKKNNDKYEEEIACAALEWIKAVLDHCNKDSSLINPSDASAVTQDGVHELLKGGDLLCVLANCLWPGSVDEKHCVPPAANKPAAMIAHQSSDRISKFLNACEDNGMKKIDLFQSCDLFDKINMSQVLNTIVALGRKSHSAEKYNGPTLGPKESEQNPRDFTEEQVAAGKTIIGLQAGTNKFANQSGQNFGKTRAIID